MKEYRQLARAAEQMYGAPLRPQIEEAVVVGVRAGRDYWLLVRHHRRRMRVSVIENIPPGDWPGEIAYRACRRRAEGQAPVRWIRYSDIATLEPVLRLVDQAAGTAD